MILIRKGFRIAAVAVMLICLALMINGLKPFSHALEPLEERPETEFKRVLILNSYEEGYRWTSEQSNAITESLKKEFDDILIFVEYMDTKYHPGPDNLEMLYELYKLKYANTEIDLLFTTDNAALEFAIKHRKDLFSEAPIVFSGVTKDTAASILKDTDSVVGIYEVLDPATTISVAAKINPGIKKIYVIYDNSRSGIDSKDLIVDALKESRYEIRYLNMFTINQIMNEVSKLDDDSIVLLGAYHSDVNGYTIPADKFSELISRASSVPVYDLQDYRLGNGVLGGCLLTGNETGRNAAELGIRLLKGESIHEMENSDKHLTACVFDYQQLERFKIPLDILPQGSTIINKPFSFFETYKTLVIGTIILIATLSIFIVLLLWHIGRRRRAELAANQANEELKALYEQLYAIDEQLKFQLTELSAAHENLRLSEEKYRLVAEATNDIIWDWNAENGQIHYSGGLKEMLGYEPTEIEDREAWSRIVLEEDQDSVTRAVIESIKNRKNLSMIEYRVKHKNGDIVWISTKAKIIFDESGVPFKIVGSHTDITKLKEYQRKIWEAAYYDELTNLPNRAYLKEYINHKINSEADTPWALIYVDVDDFKSINDNFGHREGDLLLVEVGKILREITNEEDMVFRQGGDEFVILFNQIDSHDKIADFAAALAARMTVPISLTEGKFHITLSGGIVIYPENGEDYDTLLKNADIAMYYVKNHGKNGLILFNLEMIEGSKEKLLLDHRLRSAVKDMDFTLYYQPIIDIKTSRICKFEALIRWNDSELGQVPPSVFVKCAENNGLIVPMGNWVLKESFLFAAKLESEGYENINISINISPVQIRQNDFVETVRSILDETGAKAENLELEITENILLDSLEASLNKLNEIRAMGISISLDDFGQGYSSLTYLRILPISTLKIDKSFIEYEATERNSQIVCAIIDLARGLNLKVVAEGVETKEQYEFLKENECDMIQGYYISKPLPVKEAERLIASD